MAIISAPYEIVIRFNYEIGEKAGELRGLSHEQRSFEVDAKGLIVGRLDRGPADFPKAITLEKLQEVLGAATVTIAAQLTDLNIKHQDACREWQRVTQERDNLKATLQHVDGLRVQEMAAHSDTLAALAKLLPIRAESPSTPAPGQPPA